MQSNLQKIQETEVIEPTFLKLTPERIKKDISKEVSVIREGGLLKTKTINEWVNEAKTRPQPKMLFSEFWHEGEVSILFADTGMGKSILAIQLAQSIASGIPIASFKNETEPQPVLYFDFELTDKQIENRYSENYTNHFVFSENLHRSELDSDSELPEGVSFEEYLIESLGKEIKNTGAKVLIIDNLTYLNDDLEKAKGAAPLMKWFKKIKNTLGLSVLIIAHTPKRDLSKPITRNDLGGSKVLMNFCDSAFCLGESHKSTSEKYLKQIKARNTSVIYDSENVVGVYLNKQNSFLGFEFMGFFNEHNFLKSNSEKEKEERDLKIIELKKGGRSNRGIGAEMGLSHVQVGNILKKNNVL